MENRCRARSRFHPFRHGLTRRGRGTSTVSSDKDKFQVALDVQQYHPDEINVKVVYNHIVIEAKHEEKEDERNWSSRQFTRKYMIPNQCDAKQVESHLSSDGVLTIRAPKKELPKPDSNEKVIKIQFTREPAIAPKESVSSEYSYQSKEVNQRQAGQRGKKSTVEAV